MARPLLPFDPVQHPAGSWRNYGPATKAPSRPRPPKDEQPKDGEYGTRKYIVCLRPAQPPPSNGWPKDPISGGRTSRARICRGGGSNNGGGGGHPNDPGTGGKTKGGKRF